MLALVLAFVAVFATAFDADAANRRRAIKRGSSAGAAAAIANALHSARVERGYVCYTDHFHYGSSGTQPTRAKAERAAIESWSSFVDFEYGSAWANFRRAGSKGMSCSQSGGGWDCSLEARPCRAY